MKIIQQCILILTLGLFLSGCGEIIKETSEEGLLSINAAPIVTTFPLRNNATFSYKHYDSDGLLNATSIYYASKVVTDNIALTEAYNWTAYYTLERVGFTFSMTSIVRLSDNAFEKYDTDWSAILEFPMIVGDSWIREKGFRMNQYSVESFEWVTVQAGTFYCAKIKVTITSDQGEEGESIIWLSEQAGFVKYVYAAGSYDELVSYSY
jgi:hypothetical protein